MPPAKPFRRKIDPGAARKPSAFDRAVDELRHSPGAFPNVSGRWLLGALVVALVGVGVCAWLALCLLYWQGNWQLLYHPQSAITRTPAASGIAWEPVKFATTETGSTQLTGWWIPTADSKVTVLYLHGADGNLSDSVDAIAALHGQHLGVFAIDYRGYGASQPMREAGHPSEKQLLQDSQWALNWLIQIRHIPANSIVLYGYGLGADLATEVASKHTELAGVILDEPEQDALGRIFNDSRSRLVPARWLVQDRYDLSAASAQLRVPSLWIFAPPMRGQVAQTGAAYQAVPGSKTSLWLRSPATSEPKFGESLQRWLDELRVASLPSTP